MSQNITNNDENLYYNDYLYEYDSVLITTIFLLIIIFILMIVLCVNMFDRYKNIKMNKKKKKNRPQYNIKPTVSSHL